MLSDYTPPTASIASQEKRGVPAEDVEVPTLVRIPTAAASRRIQEAEANT